jgi:hypothetical protein
MAQLLSRKVVAHMLTTLNIEQQEFINQYIKQSKKSKWLEILAQKKGIVINLEDEAENVDEKIDDWILQEVLDSGYGNLFYQCECGRTLRYQYIVRHTSKNKVYKLGETCFEHYTGLSPSIIQDIKKGLHTINEERDEILLRLKNGEAADIEEYNDIEIPELYLKQLELGLPLSTKQEAYLARKENEQWRKVQEAKQEKMRRERERKIKEFLQSLEEEQRKYVTSLDKNYIDELCQMKSFDKENVATPHLLKGIDVPEDIQYHMDIGLPLLQDQMHTLYDLQRERKTLIERKRNSLSSITYEELLERHLVTLKAVRAKEELIPKGLSKDWDEIQNAVSELKKGNDFNYGSWKMNLNNLLTPIRVDRDDYL